MGACKGIENLLSNGKNCKSAIADQFGDESYIENALMKKGRKIDLVQVPRAERDLAVATASVLARDKFIYKLREIGESYGVVFPKGSSNVIDFGKKFVNDYGIDTLPNVAKIHFSITQKITGGPIPAIREEIKIDFDTVPRETTEKDIEDARLECYNLITAFEKELRKFIEKELKKYYGDEWWERGVNDNVRGRCEKLKRIEEKKGRKVKLIDCLDFSHYSIILTDRNNWPNIFSKILGDKNKLLARLDILKSIRDPVFHTRGRINSREKLDVITSIRYLRNLMKRQKEITSFGNVKK